MPCLVTGGTGFLGRYVVEALLDREQTVTLLSRHPLPPPASCVVADLTAPTLRLGGTSFDTIYHVAGLAHKVPRTHQEQALFHEVNARGTERLLHALEQTESLPEAFVLISTVAVYGREQGHLLDEDTPRAATEPYGVSKREAEDLVLAWGARHDVRIGILRLPLVAGRKAPGNLRAMIDGITRGRYLNIGGGQARRSMVRALDVAAVVPEVARLGGIYHLTDGDHPRFAALAEALAKALGQRPPPNLPKALAWIGGLMGDGVQLATRRRMPLTLRTYQKMTATLTFSDDRARQQLGWAPSRVLDHIDELV